VPEGSDAGTPGSPDCAVSPSNKPVPSSADAESDGLASGTTGCVRVGSSASWISNVISLIEAMETMSPGNNTVWPPLIRRPLT